MRRRVFLFGAGFSANWGGFLARDLGAYLHSQLKGVLEERRIEFLKARDYEVAWATLLDSATDDSRPFVIQELERALVKAFEFQERIIYEEHGRIQINATTTMHDPVLYQVDGPVIFLTTNQDTLLERVGNGKWHVDTPGVSARSYQIEDLETGRRYVREVPAAFAPPTFNNRPGVVTLLKAHGSFDWIYNDRRVLITGQNKAADVGSFPYLQQMHTWLETWLPGAPTDLIVIGHRMADAHVTDLLETSCGNDWRVFVINPAHPSEWLSDFAGSHPNLCARIQCYLPRRFSELLNMNSTAFKSFDQSIRRPLCRV